MALILRYAVRSDLGLVRGNNEDSVYAGPRLLAIADGMGGHAAGEVASKIVIGALENLDEDRPISDLMGSLRAAVLEGNSQIAEAGEERKELEGMGTTLTALRFWGSQVGLVHVGDSRAYLLRANQLSQITHDDTYVQYLVDSGKLTPDEAKDHPRKSVILRALNGVEVEPDVSIREARPGDRYLLCTDGLSDVVSTDTMLEALQIPDAQESADRLVELALRGGGPDNVTVIVADVVNARVGDTIDEVPVIAGAFVDPSAADKPTSDSPAERAAQMSRKAAAPPLDQPSAPTDTGPSRRRRRWRGLFIVAGVLVLLAAALGGTYAWTQTQYFVGRDGTEVAIFRGVNTEFGPLKFFTVYKNTDVHLGDLNQSVRSQVRSGINANNEHDAEQIVKNLSQEMLPLCSSLTTTPTTTPTTPTTPVTPSSHRRPGGGAPKQSAHGSTKAKTTARRHSTANEGRLVRTTHATAPSTFGAMPTSPATATGAVPSIGSGASTAGQSRPPCRQ
jgi:serine/threonine protein phosphatase PrpC